MSQKIVVTAQTTSSPETSWAKYVSPESIVEWNFASEDWTCPEAKSDLRVGGRFSYRMAAKDGSMAFDYEGEWAAVEPHTRLVQKLGDERLVEIGFEPNDAGTKVTVSFDSDGQAPAEMQRQGWQAILDRYAEVASR